MSDTICCLVKTTWKKHNSGFQYLYWQCSQDTSEVYLKQRHIWRPEFIGLPGKIRGKFKSIPTTLLSLHRKWGEWWWALPSCPYFLPSRTIPFSVAMSDMTGKWIQEFPRVCECGNVHGGGAHSSCHIYFVFVKNNNKKGNIGSYFYPASELSVHHLKGRCIFYHSTLKVY